MAQMLLERLQECANADKFLVCVPTILSVCQGIIASPALSSVFTTKYELMVDLVAKFCSLACRELQQLSLTGHQKSTEPLMIQEELTSECLQTEPVGNLENSQTDLFSAPSKPKKNPQSPNLFEVLLQVLSCYLSVQRQQANPNRVFTMVTNQLLQLLVLLRHLLTSGELTSSHTHLRLHQQLCRDIRVKIDSILQLALFPVELLTLYKDELLPVKEDSGKRTTGSAKGPLKPVSAALSKLTAQGYCEPSLHYTVKSNTLSLLFKFFLERYGKAKGDGEDEHKMLCFYYLTRLVPVLDLHLAQHSVSTTEVELPHSVCPQPKSPSLSSPESWSLALLAVESLLSQTLSADIYNVAADRIRHGEVQLQYYRALAQLLFNEAQPSIPSWYRCLKVLLNLNHLILEPDLDQLLSSAWVNAECMEPRVLRARQLMVCSLLQTYTKLRQLSRLFSELLSVICQPALDDLRPPLLPEGISTSLRNCLLDIPQSQGLEICSLVLENVRKFVLPDLLREGTDAEKMETDGESTDQEKKDAALKLSSLSQLLHAVSFSLKTLDNASPVPLVRQSRDMMERMQQLVQDLHMLTEEKLQKADKSSLSDTNDKTCPHPEESERISQSKTGSLWEQQTQEAALLLRYTWIEVDTLFEIHCSKYSSLDSAHSLPGTRIENLLSGDISPAHLHPSPSSSPMSCLLLKLLTLQQIKKILMDSASFGEATTTALLQRAAQFILAKPEFETSLDGEQGWDLQIGSLNSSSYFVAHWYLVVSNLPLIISHLSAEDMDCIADVLVSSLLKRDIDRSEDQQLGSLTVSAISSEFLQSSVLSELPLLFSAVVKSLAQRIIHELKAATALKDCRALQMFQKIETEVSVRNVGFSLSTLVNTETLVEDVQESSKTGEVSLLLSNTSTGELVNVLQILTKLNPDAMSSEDLSSVFLLLFFLLTLTSSQQDQTADGSRDSEGGTLFPAKLLQTLAYLLEGRNIHGVFKVVHGAALLQAPVSTLLWRSNSGKFDATCGADWLALIKATQGFIKSLVQLIITRNSSVQLNLDQFATYLSSAVVASRKSTVSSSGASVSSIHLLLACLASFSQTMTSNLGRNKQVDQTLTQMLVRTNALLGPAVEFVLKPQTAPQPACTLGQAFIVDVVTVMIRCELSSLSVEENQQCRTFSHMSLYQGFCHQIFREISSAPRPMDFLISSLHFLSAFYKAVEETDRKTKEQEEVKKAGKEEVYIQILQNVHRLLKAHWLSAEDVCQLEPAVQELLSQLLVKSSADELNVLLLMVRDGLDIDKLRAGNYREVLSAVIVIKLLSCCQLPETCSKVLWLIAPQVTSAMVALVRTSSQDASLTLPFTLPTVTAMTTLLRREEGLIPNAHHVVLVLGALQSVPLTHMTPPAYQSAFLAVHEALFAILQCHPQVVTDAAPSFLNVFHRLLASIMQEGRQRGDGDIDSDADVFVPCSRLIERMYSHIAAATESFTMLSAFMVAQYVTELQKVTLRPDVKLHLTEGIYYILDLCKEQDMKFLKAGLQAGVREVFNELYSSYTHYHKTQRQGEEKYTV
ncbi:unhealthy ribosome biogenesis protein 2 homolog isoform X2 [Salarias fasciatus]|nr:unhealthy ribosome biogenesis protein 2 homolog isoform X2 [Salarias fasciatus]